MVLNTRVQLLQHSVVVHKMGNGTGVSHASVRPSVWYGLAHIDKPSSCRSTRSNFVVVVVVAFVVEISPSDTAHAKTALTKSLGSRKKICNRFAKVRNLLHQMGNGTGV